MPQGALLLHGFTATPESLGLLTTSLKEKGFLVEAPLLPGHGTTARDLGEKTWQDWYEGAVGAYQKLKGKVDSVCVAGLSMGGLLTLMLASEFPVDRIALLATPVIFVGFMTDVVLPLVGNTPLHHLYQYHPKFVGGAINDPEARKDFVSYTKMPIKGIMQILKLQVEVKKRLPSIHVPALIVHSVRDTVAPYQNMEFIKNHLGTKTVKTVTLERSNHVITLDYDKNLVCEEVVDFFGGRL